MPCRPERPVRVLQFGTGRFLMGFIGAFVDRANRAGDYDGHALIVQSTGSDRAALIAAQDGRYTLIERDGAIETRRLIDAYADAVSVIDAWDRILDVARSPDLAVIVSNVTEGGLAIDSGETIDAPASYPARLTLVLVERWRAGMPGVVVLPCELVVGNGRVLNGLVRDLAARWGLEAGFTDWLATHCVFSNTLVDRIVTGLPSAQQHRALEAELGYRDALLTVAEPYALFAIQGDADLAKRIGFVAANPAIRIEPDITRYRDLKLRLLNGGHSASAAVAILLGHRLVREAMADADFAAFVDGLLRDEIAPTLAVPADIANAYIDDVLARWCNAAIDHQWRDIASGYAAKIGMRLLPAPGMDRLAIGIAAVDVLMRDPAFRSRAAWPEGGVVWPPDFASLVAAGVASIDSVGIRATISGYPR